MRCLNNLQPQLLRMKFKQFRAITYLTTVLLLLFYRSPQCQGGILLFCFIAMPLKSTVRLRQTSQFFFNKVSPSKWLNLNS